MHHDSAYKKISYFFRQYVFVFDWFLLLILLLLATLGLVTLYSAVGGFDERFYGQVRNYGLAFLLMWGAILIPHDWLKRGAIPLYLLGIVLLLLVDLTALGDSSKGAERWLNLGIVRIQPSEIMKIAMPLLLAWFINFRNGIVKIPEYLVIMIAVLVPFYLIKTQPDFGTSVLVLISAFFILYLNGLSLRLIVPIALIGVIGIGLLVYYEDQMCRPDVAWYFFENFQKNRVCTALDPTQDPFGKGFHIIQSMIAVGSGGLHGKGFLNGTQAHLDFIPEQWTDFIFAVFAEEQGLVAGIVLLLLYIALIARGMMISARANDIFSRLLGGALSLSFFVYVFVNIGMVTGILPVVGVPLPFMSYGGTALIALSLAIGLIMGINRKTRLERQH